MTNRLTRTLVDWLLQHEVGTRLRRPGGRILVAGLLLLALGTGLVAAAFGYPPGLARNLARVGSSHLSSPSEATRVSPPNASGEHRWADLELRQEGDALIGTSGSGLGFAGRGAGEVIDAPRQHDPGRLVDPFRAGPVIFGVYDPDGMLAGVSDLTVEEGYVPWWPTNADGFGGWVKAIRSRGRTPVMTVEPWPFVGMGYSTQTLLEDVARGWYDHALWYIARSAKSDGGLIYVRWGHEMELCGLYPWSTCRPDAYLAAYRHVVTYLRREGASNLRFIWSPAGEAQAVEYWPGSEYADAVGVDAMISEEWAAQAGTSPQPFATSLDHYLARFAAFGKPIVVTELGVAMDDPERRAGYLAAAVRAVRVRPQVRGLLYFNQRQPENSFGVTRPDWRLDRTGTATFLAEIGRARAVEGDALSSTAGAAPEPVWP